VVLDLVLEAAVEPVLAPCAHDVHARHHLWVEGLGLRFQKFGMKAMGLGFRVWGLGFRV
jgi:hypothetical protein